MSDDDGSRRARITAEQVRDWVSYANSVFSSAGISFAFDPKADLADLDSTILNNMTGVQDPNWRVARQLGNSIAALYPGKLVIYFRWGPGGNPTGAGFSWWDYNFIAAPGFDDTSVCGHQNIGLLAHEIGHYSGLPHPFARIFGTVAEAEAFFIGNGRDPNVFDGDRLGDTAPDPFIRELQCAEPESVILDGYEFLLQIDNTMGYWDFATKTLTPDQAARVNWLLDVRRARQMAMPTNFDAPDPIEFDSLPVLASRNMGYGRQFMEGFGIDQWAGNDHLFCGAGPNGLITFELDVPRAANYQIELYATRAPDFGIVGAWWDGHRMGDDLDLYAPLVIPTDGILLEPMFISSGPHILTFEVLGKNAASTGYFFGLDCLTLTESCDPCDMNCDGTVDASDIEFFIDILFNGATPCGACTGDTNGDGSIDAADIEGFINCLFP